MLEENGRQRCQPIADRISSIISEYEKAGNDRNKLSTFNTLSQLCPDFLPYRDLETSITALVDSNAFALSLPLFLLSDLLSKHQVVNSIVRLELEPPAT